MLISNDGQSRPSHAVFAGRHAIFAGGRAAERVGGYGCWSIVRGPGMINSRLECQSKSSARRRLSHSSKRQSVVRIGMRDEAEMSAVRYAVTRRRLRVEADAKRSEICRPKHRSTAAERHEERTTPRPPSPARLSVYRPWLPAPPPQPHAVDHLTRPALLSARLHRHLLPSPTAPSAGSAHSMGICSSCLGGRRTSESDVSATQYQSRPSTVHGS
jgi:hypothetical protein